MKRLSKRWLVILMVWIAIVAIPPLRHLAQSQLRNTIWPLTALAGSDSEQGSYADLVAEYPHDARVWAMAADESPFAPQYSDDADEPMAIELTKTARLFPGQQEKEQHTEKRRRLDLVIEKFPNEAWLIAKRLKYSWGYMYGDRIGGELSDSNLAANQAAGKPSPERRSDDFVAPPPAPGSTNASQRTKQYPNYTPQELQRVLALCKRGQQLEPNNAYYDWTESYFLALAWRDREAWRALDAAAKKTRWDDHQLDDVRARIAASELLAHRPLLWEEKFVMLYAWLFPQYARYREYARIVSWQSIKAQRRGDHAQALRLIGDLAKVTAKMRDNSKFLIERLVAVAMETIAVSGATYDARKGTVPSAWRRGTPKQQTQARFNSFNAYALAHGRRDLAQWLARDATKAAAARVPISINTITGTSFESACLMRLLWIAGVLLLLALPLCLLGWLMLSGLVRIRLVRNLLGWSTPPAMPGEELTKRDIVIGAIACGGLNLLGYALLGLLSTAITISVIAFSLGQFGALTASIGDAWSSLLMDLSSNTFSGTINGWEGLFYLLLGNSAIGGPRDAYLLFARWLMALLPVVFGALWCAHAAVHRQRQWQRSGEAQPSPPSSTGSLSAFFQAALHGRLFDSPRVARLEESAERHFDLMEFLATLLRGIGIGVFWIAWIVAAFWPGRNEALYFFLPLAVAIATGSALWLDVLARWRIKRAAVSHRRRAARYGLRLLRESWLGWLALGSLLFLLSLLLAEPLRARANYDLDRYLRLGEVAMMK
jgi:hypothetical protein